MHAPDMVFANHTAGERARARRSGTSRDLRVLARHQVRDPAALRARGLVVQEWTATATHTRDAAPRRHRGAPSGRTVAGRDRRDPLRGRPGQAQGRLLGLGLDPAPGRPARLSPAQLTTLRELIAQEPRPAAGPGCSGKDDWQESSRTMRSVAKPSSPRTMRSTACQEIGPPPTVPLSVNSISTPSGVAPQRCTSPVRSGTSSNSPAKARFPSSRVSVVGVIGATRRT